jgi:hypothetical protein
VPKTIHRTATPDHPLLELPEQVTFAVAELAGAAREGLLALAVGTGMQVLQVMLAEDVARLVGPKGRHNPDRAAVRHGSEPGQVTLGGPPDSASTSPDRPHARLRITTRQAGGATTTGRRRRHGR